MYVDILAISLQGWTADLAGPDLVEYAVACRGAVRQPGAYAPGSSCDTLAAEIAYDRALIRLCQAHGIVVDPTAFVYPDEARARIEIELAVAGVDLLTER